MCWEPPGLGRGTGLAGNPCPQAGGGSWGHVAFGMWHQRDMGPLGMWGHRDMRPLESGVPVLGDPGGVGS